MILNIVNINNIRIVKYNKKTKTIGTSLSEVLESNSSAEADQLEKNQNFRKKSKFKSIDIIKKIVIINNISLNYLKPFL